MISQGESLEGGPKTERASKYDNPFSMPSGPFELILGRHSNSRPRQIGFSARIRSASRGKLITYSGDGHAITFAPTRTGKTSGPVICNALHHRGQLVVIDIKGEVYAATAARRREMGQEVHVLDLRDGGHAGSLNPLDLALRWGTDPAALGRSLAAEVVIRGPDEHDRFWNDWAETLIAGGVAWMLADCPPEERSVGRLFDIFNKDDVSYQLAVMLDKKQIRNKAALAAIYGFLQLSDRETRPSVLGTLQTHLRLFDSELSRRLTDSTSFDIDAFIKGDPMSLYIIVPASRLLAYRPLLKLWLSGLLLVLTQRSAPPKNRTLLLCDEIGNLGRMDAFLMAATLMAGWGVTLWSFWQNPDQLKVYGDQANTLVDNAGVVQVFGARNRRLAQDFAALVGGVDSDAILNMEPGEQLLLIEGGKPLRCLQTRYYEDVEFRESRSL